MGMIMELVKKEQAVLCAFPTFKDDCNLHVGETSINKMKVQIKILKKKTNNNTYWGGCRKKARDSSTILVEI